MVPLVCSKIMVFDVASAIDLAIMLLTILLINWFWSGLVGTTGAIGSLSCVDGNCVVSSLFVWDVVALIGRGGNTGGNIVTGKPKYKNRYIVMPYELDNLLTFEDFLLSITDLELLVPYSKKQVYNKDVTKRPLSILNDKRELQIQSQVDNYVQEFSNVKWFDIIKQTLT